MGVVSRSWPVAPSSSWRGARGSNLSNASSSEACVVLHEVGGREVKGNAGMNAATAALVVGAVLVTSCSRLSPSIRADAAPPPTKRDATARDVPSDGTDTGSDGGKEANAANPGVAASPAVEIALEDAPLLTVRALGPSLIELTLSDRAPAAWKTVEVERRVASEEPRQHDKFEQSTGRLRVVAPHRHVHSAKPATTYAYRARTTGPWSPEVIVRTAAPGGPPPGPTSFDAKATTPFAVRLSWEADAQMVAGFEIEVASDGNPYVRAALVDATVREFVHHHRLPKREYSYRVRAFNGLGPSARSPVVPVTTPEHGRLESAARPPCEPLPKASPNMPHDVVNHRGGKSLYSVPDRTNPLKRHLFGEYEGCFRDFGAFELQDPSIVAIEDYVDEGFPLVRGVAGAGEFVGAQLHTMRFSRGRYTLVDIANFCGSPAPDRDPADPSVGTEAGDDLSAHAPPFEKCQRDFRR